jgi:hypothetical protein
MGSFVSFSGWKNPTASVSSAVWHEVTLELEVRRNLDDGSDSRCTGEASSGCARDEGVGECVNSGYWRFLWYVGGPQDALQSMMLNERPRLSIYIARNNERHAVRHRFRCSREHLRAVSLIHLRSQEILQFWLWRAGQRTPNAAQHTVTAEASVEGWKIELLKKPGGAAI